jgi:hypothetical protein
MCRAAESSHSDFGGGLCRCTHNLRRYLSAPAGMRKTRATRDVMRAEIQAIPLPTTIQSLPRLRCDTTQILMCSSFISFCGRPVREQERGLAIFASRRTLPNGLHKRRVSQRPPSCGVRQPEGIFSKMMSLFTLVMPTFAQPAFRKQ